MHLPVLTPALVTTAEFITYWQRLYDYGNEETYLGVMSKPYLTSADITSLFQWKNNMGSNPESISSKKRVFLRKVVTRLDKVNQMKKSFDFNLYMTYFEDLPVIWGSTLLHVVSSGDYPIYDQHVHRAFSYCTTGSAKEIPSSKRKKSEVYTQQYIPFFQDIRSSVPEVTTKQIDDALWSFGKFLGRYPSVFTTQYLARYGDHA